MASSFDFKSASTAAASARHHTTTALSRLNFHLGRLDFFRRRSFAFALSLTPRNDMPMVASEDSSCLPRWKACYSAHIYVCECSCDTTAFTAFAKIPMFFLPFFRHNNISWSYIFLCLIFLGRQTSFSRSVFGNEGKWYFLLFMLLVYGDK